MKRMIAVLFAGLLMAQGAAFAADGDQKDMSGGFHQKRLEKLATELKLTPDQKQKMSDIFKQTGDEIKAEMEKMKTIKDNADQKIKGVLSAEQYQKYEQMKQERKSQMKKKMKGAMQDQMGAQQGQSTQPTQQ